MRNKDVEQNVVIWVLVVCLLCFSSIVQATDGNEPDCGYEHVIEDDPLAEVGWELVEEEESVNSFEAFSRSPYSDGIDSQEQGWRGESPLLEVKFNRLNNFDSRTRAKVFAAKNILEDILSSEEFQDAVIRYVYNKRRRFADNKGYSNSQILDVIYDAHEPTTSSADGTMNLYLTLTTLPKGVVGQAYVGGLGIKVNRSKYANYSPAQIGRSLLHEWLHNMGFNHDKTATSRRTHSVPYAIGSIFEKMAREFY